FSSTRATRITCVRSHPSKILACSQSTKLSPSHVTGAVWTDEDANIIRISEHLELSDNLKAYRGWEDCQVVLTYGWLNRENDPPRLVPLTIFAVARYKKHVHWCRGQFRDYQIFSTRARIIASSQP